MGAKESASGERGTGGDPEVMAAVDRSGDAARLVIADVTRDDAWISILESEAPTVPAWR